MDYGHEIPPEYGNNFNFESPEKFSPEKETENLETTVEETPNIPSETDKGIGSAALNQDPLNNKINTDPIPIEEVPYGGVPVRAASGESDLKEPNTADPNHLSDEGKKKELEILMEKLKKEKVTPEEFEDFVINSRGLSGGEND